MATHAGHKLYLQKLVKKVGWRGGGLLEQKDREHDSVGSTDVTTVSSYSHRLAFQHADLKFQINYHSCSDAPGHNLQVAAFYVNSSQCS